MSNGLQASCRPHCRGHHGHGVFRAARRCACEEENEIPGRYDDAVARRPQHRAGKDLLVRHVSLRRVRRAGRPLLSLSSLVRELPSRFAIAEQFVLAPAAVGATVLSRGNSAYMTPRAQPRSQVAPLICNARRARCMRRQWEGFAKSTSACHQIFVRVSSSFATRAKWQLDQTGSSR